MYKIDLVQNRIHKLPSTNFSSSSLRERQHLQEWLAYCPSALGEELLIIQKEFDGFDDTRERLDLLALDKDGCLVVIENKLDDSGRDVVWQALKYASYCSTLSKSQIVDIFQLYLDAQGVQEVAKQAICEFLEISPDDFESFSLNHGNSQRIFLVAAHFRKEVTSTALWLLGNGLNIQCYKATPYQLGTELFLSIDQVIPFPEAKEFMISMSIKEQEQQATERTQSQVHLVRREFWTRTLEALKTARILLFSGVSPSQDHWLNTGSGISSITYTMIFGRGGVRVELELKRSEGRENKWLFDYLEARKAQIEQRFGAPLSWLRLDDWKTSRIEYAKEINGFNKETWPELIEWFVRYVPCLERAFKPEIDGMSNHLKALQAQNNSSETELVP